MQKEILLYINNPERLEALYRADPSGFKQAFNLVYNEIQENASASFWRARLNYTKSVSEKKSTSDIIFLIIMSLMAGVIAKIPEFADIQDFGLFYPYNLSFIVFPFLIFYFLRQHRPGFKILVFPLAAIIVSVIYMNLIPKNQESSSIILACVHVALFLWSVTGYAFLGSDLRNNEKRIDFLRFNGDLVIMINIILLAGGTFVGITIGLFEMINKNVATFIMEYVVVFGATAVPIFGTYLVQRNPALVQKISPLVARIFTPIVFVMLLVYLITVIYTQKDPYNNRDFLILFNALLIGVMAIIFFSLSETVTQERNRFNLFILLGLSLLTMIIDGIVLSAILFRVGEWGITPNRAAVLGENILIFINLTFVTNRLLKAIRNQSTPYEVENSIALFLPLYGLWFGFVTFFFPILFGFR